MPNYTNGKVYKLVNNVDDLIYIGSTCQSLAKRKGGHKRMSKSKPDILVYTHLISIGWDNVRIVLIESVNASNKEELLSREQHYIDIMNPSLNKRSANSICEHNTRKDRCKKCKGKGICKHNKRTIRCKKCKGSQICKHSNVKSLCIGCNGVSLCSHKTERRNCKDCNGDKYKCHECDIILCGKSSLTRHIKKQHKKKYKVNEISVKILTGTS
jgi:hypothetical protein